MKDISKMSFMKKPFELFRQKKYLSSLNQRTPWHTQPLNATIEIKTVGTWQDKN